MGRALIVVSGSGRSGTSMWMQVLAAAGVPVVGEAFPRDWETRISAANRRGFFESTLVHGINFTSNPDPRTGARLDPETSRELAVKVLLRGVRHSSARYLDRVLVSVRGWRAYRSSVLRLESIERESSPDMPQLPFDPALAWFTEHVMLCQDLAQRRYRCRFVSYEAVLADPAKVVPEVLAWLGVANPAAAAAVAAVDPRLCTQGGDRPTAVGLPLHWEDALDTLDRALAAGAVSAEILAVLEPVFSEIQASS